MKRHRLALTYLLTGLVLLAAAAFDLCTGAVHLTPAEIFGAVTGSADSRTASIVLGLRLPRILTAMLAGAGLAVSGALMQTVFRNPLADPHILGVSAGAGTGVAVATVLSAGTGIVISISAAAGALCTALLIIWISSRIRRASALLVTGVMMGFILSALTSAIEYQADEMHLKMFWNWSAGSFEGCGWNGICLCAAALAAGSMIAMSQSKGLSLMLFGDEFASGAGADVRRIRFLSMLACSIMTGTITAFCGPIGFTGIVAPHIARSAGGKSALKHVIPLSILTGAAICTAGDILSRIWKTPLPAGSATALIGIPLIFFIIRKYQDR